MRVYHCPLSVTLTFEPLRSNVCNVSDVAWLDSVLNWRNRTNHGGVIAIQILKFEGGLRSWISPWTLKKTFATFACRPTLRSCTKFQRNPTTRWRVIYNATDFPDALFGAILTGQIRGPSYSWLVDSWLVSTVGRTSVFGWRTDPVLVSACSRRVTTMK